ncbi:MAG: ribonuclease HII [Desulfitobacteriaceae bacterium]|nr:ribonuclease HII [Desulfitobacteriaceae bacterium]MDD4345943.1 ribonuclease HII [Desulfitobacteriaceae bacterium]MDD4401379.1 ribonuclease HII [Desulfitobacteriaceae bacterium]
MLSGLNIREIEVKLRNNPPEFFLKACLEAKRSGVRRLAEKHLKNKQTALEEEKRIQRLLYEEKKLWNQGFLMLAGLDEAGRGSLAGSVVAAACILPAKFYLPGLNDSKKISESRREKLCSEIKLQALDYSLGSAEPAEIDILNILEATKLAMKRALKGLRVRPHFLLIDALELPVDLPQLSLTGGDGLSASIAAASILAKVTRDRLMKELHFLYPEYGFNSNKGYGTVEHIRVLERIGPCPLHRRSFAPVNQRVSNE